jgi:ABC-2 type transport system ATP-binding protein
MTQHPKLLDWMRVRQLLNYVSEFYARWDRTLAVSLVERLSLDVDARVQTLSPGNRQKLALVLALCHHPDLLLLDEPLSDLDPMARKDVLDILLERYNADGPALLVSSHLLHDIEPIIGRIVCLDRGKVTTDEDLDSLKESYEAWQVTARDGVLPAEWKDPWVVRAEGDRFAAQLVVRREAGRADSVSRALNADVSVRALNLEQLFPLLIQEPVDAR